MHEMKFSWQSQIVNKVLVSESASTAFIVQLCFSLMAYWYESSSKYVEIWYIFIVENVDWIYRHSIVILAFYVYDNLII